MKAWESAIIFLVSFTPFTLNRRDLELTNIVFFVKIIDWTNFRFALPFDVSAIADEYSVHLFQTSFWFPCILITSSAVMRSGAEVLRRHPINVNTVLESTLIRLGSTHKSSALRLLQLSLIGMGSGAARKLFNSPGADFMTIWASIVAGLVLATVVVFIITIRQVVVINNVVNGDRVLVRWPRSRNRGADSSELRLMLDNFMAKYGALYVGYNRGFFMFGMFYLVAQIGIAVLSGALINHPNAFLGTSAGVMFLFVIFVLYMPVFTHSRDKYVFIIDNVGFICISGIAQGYASINNFYDAWWSVLVMGILRSLVMLVHIGVLLHEANTVRKRPIRPDVHAIAPESLRVRDDGRDRHPRALLKLAYDTKGDFEEPEIDQVLDIHGDSLKMEITPSDDEFAGLNRTETLMNREAMIRRQATKHSRSPSGRPPAKKAFELISEKKKRRKKKDKYSSESFEESMGSVFSLTEKSRADSQSEILDSGSEMFLASKRKLPKLSKRTK